MPTSLTRNLVTGGAGFLGSHLVDRLEVDRIWHLACPALPVHYQYNPIKTSKTSFLGTYNMLGLARRVKSRLLLASTSEVYGDPEVHPQPESYRGCVNIPIAAAVRQQVQGSSSQQRRATSSSAKGWGSRRPTTAPIALVGTVKSLSAISWDGLRRPLLSLGSTGMRTRGASSRVLVSGQSVTLGCCGSQRLACTMTAGRGFPAYTPALATVTISPRSRASSLMPSNPPSPEAARSSRRCRSAQQSGSTDAEPRRRC